MGFTLCLLSSLPHTQSHNHTITPKHAVCFTQVTVGGKPVQIGGMCKGSGMIHPNMATMLGIVTCDAAVEPAVWRDMLRRACDASFNAVSAVI